MDSYTYLAHQKVMKSQVQQKLLISSQLEDKAVFLTRSKTRYKQHMGSKNSDIKKMIMIQLS